MFCFSMFTSLSQGYVVLITLLRSLLSWIRCVQAPCNTELFAGIDSPFLLPSTTDHVWVGGLQHSGLCTKHAYVHSGFAHPTTPIFVLAPILVITNNLKVFKSFILALILKQKKIGNFLTTSIVILATKCLSRLICSKITLT